MTEIGSRGDVRPAAGRFRAAGFAGGALCIGAGGVHRAGRAWAAVRGAIGTGS